MRILIYYCSNLKIKPPLYTNLFQLPAPNFVETSGKSFMHTVPIMILCLLFQRDFAIGYYSSTVKDQGQLLGPCITV